MGSEVYYRYFYENISVFRALENWCDKQTRKRAGKEWAKEHAKLTRRINWKIKWLPEPEFDEKVNFYFKEKGAKKYEKTLMKIHKEILGDKIEKKKFVAFRKSIGDKETLYNKRTKRKIGEIVYEDKYQIGIKNNS